jgi:hypothetical protein
LPSFRPNWRFRQRRISLAEASASRNPGNKENWITAFAVMTREAPTYSVNF